MARRIKKIGVRRDEVTITTDRGEQLTFTPGGQAMFSRMARAYAIGKLLAEMAWPERRRRR